MIRTTPIIHQSAARHTPNLALTRRRILLTTAIAWGIFSLPTSAAPLYTAKEIETVLPAPPPAL